MDFWYSVIGEEWWSEYCNLSDIFKKNIDILSENLPVCTPLYDLMRKYIQGGRG